jgi:hypothetical protein
MTGEAQHTTSARISTLALSEVQAAMKEYWAVLDESELSEASKGMYMDMAGNFVRWMSGEFVPGSQKNPYPFRKRKKDPIAS